MSDLPKKLRTHQKLQDLTGGSETVSGKRLSIHEDAADEIDRLAADNARLAAENAEWKLISERDLALAIQYGETIDELRADNARLAAIIERNKGNASHRLHNICDALSEQAYESPFTREAWDEQDKLIASVTAERDALQAQLEQWTKWGTIEVAIRNPNVSSYMEHWEGRATKAEAQVAGLKAALLRYGTHLHSCHYGGIYADRPCDCGFDEAIGVARTALVGEGRPESVTFPPEMSMAESHGDPRITDQPSVARTDELPVLGAGGADAPPMPTADDACAAYERLYKNRIEMTMVKWGFTPHEAALNAQAEWDGAEITDFSDDPEAAADESMSYWDHDG